MPSLKTKPEANITMIFSTEEENGILIYNGESQHIAVELFRGRIRVSYDVGNYPVSNMFRCVIHFIATWPGFIKRLLHLRNCYSYETVSDGRYHTVELLSQKKNFTLRVDQGNARSMINEGEHEYLRLSTPLFIGGLPNEAAEKAARQWQLRNTTSFRGCIKGLYCNSFLFFYRLFPLSLWFHVVTCRVCFEQNCGSMVSWQITRKQLPNKTESSPAAPIQSPKRLPRKW